MKHSRPDYDRIQDPDGLIPEDEPVFFLRAQDHAGAATVRFWACRAEAYHADPVMVENARRQADRMEAWPIKKIPDMPSLSPSPSVAPASPPAVPPGEGGDPPHGQAV